MTKNLADVAFKASAGIVIAGTLALTFTTIAPSVMKPEAVIVPTQEMFTAAEPNSSAAVNVVPVEPLPFVETFTSPYASSQPTTHGQGIHDIHIQDNELYAGYGDYGENTGPVAISSMNLSDHTWTDHLSFPGEEVNVIREIGGKLYIPNIDPKASWNRNVGYASNVSGSWENYNLTPFIHVFDIATTDGKDIWLSGSIANSDGSPAGAAVKRSTDGGKTWTVERQVQSVDPALAAQEFDRYYWMGSVDGKIYVKSTLSDSSTGAPSLDKWENGEWSKVETSTASVLDYNAQNVTAFKGKIFMGGTMLTTINPVDDSTTQVNGVINVNDFYATSDALYALSSATGSFYVTYNGMNWLQVTTAISPTEYFETLAVDKNSLYFGGSDGSIQQFDLTAFNTYIQSNPIVVEGLEDLHLLKDSSADVNTVLMENMKVYETTGSDLTASATVNHDVDMSKTGVYTATYTYVDSSGVSHESIRKVFVDPSKSVELRSSVVFISMNNETYNPEEYVKAYAREEGVQVFVSSESTVVLQTPGVYKTTYIATDSLGSTVTLTVPVIVLPL